ncbi:hypothetical protein OAK35_00430 [Crocinitomicaceae bacterium]|nr:hypothetical protein [Crocinitomicaceae bacterium]
MLANFNYHCPHCQTQLNKGSQIEFLVGYKDHQKTPLLLSKEPGVYGYRSKHNLVIENGDKVDFYCHSCEEPLQSLKRPGLVEIQIWTDDAPYLDLFFSATCGERLTYVEMEGELMRFGSDFFSIMKSRA